MAIPLSPEEQARVDAYWSGAPQSPAAAPGMSVAPDPQTASYWGIPPAPEPELQPAGPPPPPVPAEMAPPAPLAPPYQPNPGLPGYQPNPGVTTEVAPQPLATGPASIGPSAAPSASDFVQGAQLSMPPGPVLQQEAARQGAIGGPTAGDNAAFEQFKAGLAAPSPAPAARGGVANPDPYGIGAAQRAQLASFDDRMGAMGRAATAEQGRAIITAEHAKNLARMQEEDAAIARAEQEYAARHFDEQMTELGRQLDDVKSRKVDPLKDFKESPALGVLAVVGGAISGFYQGLAGGQQNEFLADLDRHIERGVSEQERQIRDEKFVLGEGINMLHQQRQSQKDDALAKMQLRNLSYEAVKNEIAAEADRVGTDIAKANADAAIATVQGQQAVLQEQIARQKQAQSLAAAGRAYSQAKEVKAAYLEVYKEVLSTTKNPAQAEAEARRAVGVIYAPGSVGARTETSNSNPLALVPNELRSEATKEYTTAASTRKVLASIQGSFQDWRRTGVTSPRQLDSTRSAIAGTIMSSVPGIRSDIDFKEIVEPNLPKMGDSEETLRKKEATINRFVESKVATPILDAHVPGWRQPTKQEADAALGAKPVR